MSWIWNNFQTTRFHLLENQWVVRLVTLVLLFSPSDALYLILMLHFCSTPLSGANKLFNFNFILFILSQHIKGNQSVEFENVIYLVSSNIFLLFVCFSKANIDDERRYRKKNQRGNVLFV